MDLLLLSRMIKGLGRRYRRFSLGTLLFMLLIFLITRRMFFHFVFFPQQKPGSSC